MALTRVQAAPKALGNPCNITFPAPPTVGNGLVVAVVAYGSNPANVTCVDNCGNAYWLSASRTQSNPHVALYHCEKIVGTGAPFTITVTGISCFATAIEVAGLGTDSLVIEKSATQIGTSVTPSTGTTAALTVADVFMVIATSGAAVISSITVETVSPSWVQEAEDTAFLWASGEVDSRELTGVSGTTQSGSWTQNTSGAWVGVIVAYKAGASPSMRLSQAAIETLSQPVPEARITQSVVELLSAPVPAVRVTHYVIEVLNSSFLVATGILIPSGVVVTAPTIEGGAVVLAVTLATRASALQMFGPEVKILSANDLWMGSGGRIWID